MPGPVGKRDSERRRRNKPAIETVTVDIADLIQRDIELPEADPDWEPLTHAYWESFASSGQAMFYEPSDWMTAYMLMEVLDRHLKPQDIRTGEIRPAQQEGGEVEYVFTAKIIPIPGNVLSSILKGMTSLMATEGDRRRLKIELERRAAMEAAAGGEATVTDILKNRSDAFAG